MLESPEFWAGVIEEEDRLMLEKKWKWYGDPGDMMMIQVDGIRSLNIPELRNIECCAWRIYVNHAKNDWSERGEIQSWNGNVDAPTLESSIILKLEGVEIWHGWITNGEFEDADGRCRIVARMDNERGIR